MWVCVVGDTKSRPFWAFPGQWPTCRTWDFQIMLRVLSLYVETQCCDSQPAFFSRPPSITGLHLSLGHSSLSLRPSAFFLPAML